MTQACNDRVLLKLHREPVTRAGRGLQYNGYYRCCSCSDRFDGWKHLWFMTAMVLVLVHMVRFLMARNSSGSDGNSFCLYAQRGY